MSNPYRKDVRHLDEIDLYVLADLYEVKSHAVFHAIKKLICAGKRGAKDYEQDLMEAIESIERELQMLPVTEEAPTADFDEQRIDAIGQNGNDGEHYEPVLTLTEVLKALGPAPLARDWTYRVDWSKASPHHQFAYQNERGDIVFSMHQPMGYDFIGRPTAQ